MKCIFFVHCYSVENQEYFHNWITRAIARERSHQESFTKGAASGQGLLVICLSTSKQNQTIF